MQKNHSKDILLVATQVPEGKIVHTELGIKSSADYQKPWFDIHLHCWTMRDIDNIYSGKYIGPEYIQASKVGLEWRQNGKKIEASDIWAEKSFVLISNKRNVVDEIIWTKQ